MAGIRPPASSGEDDNPARHDIRSTTDPPKYVSRQCLDAKWRRPAGIYRQRQPAHRCGNRKGPAQRGRVVNSHRIRPSISTMDVA
jgi:hypothetical protein